MMWAVAWLVLMAAVAHAGAPSVQAAAGVTLTPAELAWRQQHPVIRVGVYTGDHLPADTWVAGRPEGMAIDYVRLLASRVGLRIEFRPYTDWVAVNFPQQGQRLPYDLIAALPVRPQTGYTYLKPFGRGYSILVARKGDVQIRTERDLADARIAVDRTHRDLVARLQAAYPDARFVFANSNRDAMELVAQHRADAFVGVSEVNTRGLLMSRDRDDLVLLGVVSSLPARDVAPALPNDNPMLLQLLRRAEDSVTADELHRLVERWGVDEPLRDGSQATALLSPQERQWLRTLRPLRIGYEVDRAPYTFINAQGRFDGLAADYVELIRKALDVRVELVPANDWNSLQRMVRAREVDMVAAAMPEDFSTQDMVFSRPYEHFPEVIVTRQQDVRSPARRTWSAGSSPRARRPACCPGCGCCCPTAGSCRSAATRPASTWSPTARPMPTSVPCRQSMR